MSSQAEPESADVFSDMLIGAARTMDVVIMKRAIVYFLRVKRKGKKGSIIIRMRVNESLLDESQRNSTVCNMVYIKRF